MPLHRIRSTWNGTTGLPGISTFYSSAPPSDLELLAIQNFWGDIAAFIPDAVTIQVEPFGDILDTATGQLTGSWDVGITVPLVNCTGLGGYAANAGLCLGWNTEAVVDGRRLKGRTFLVPAAPVCFSGGGTPSSETSQIRTAAEEMATVFAGRLQVWHRPRPGLGGAPGSGGSVGTIIGAYISSRTSQLKSRRD